MIYLSRLTITAILISTTSLSRAQSESTEDFSSNQNQQNIEKPYNLEFKPVILDGASSSGSTLGLDYDLKASYPFAMSRTGVGQNKISLKDLNKIFTAGQVDLHARGTLASSKEKNPNNFLDFLLNGVLKLNTPSAYYKLGGKFAYETDQGFEKRQHMVGLTTSVSKVRIFTAGDSGSILLSYGTVKPSNDINRENISGSLKSFRRWDAEISYSIPLFYKKIRSIDFNYRIYQEVNAPTALKNAGMDRNQFGLIRINFDQDFFFQYSRGSLPFDQKSERVVKLGWSLKFE